jgi:hypothetical protein
MTTELSIRKARSILKEAKKDHGDDYPPVFEGDIPDDEDKMVAEAVELVEMSEQAKDNDQDHPAIDKILFLAEVDGDSKSNTEATGEPIDGYYDMKAGAIIRQLPELDDDELSQVFEYERENKNREPIIESLEEIAEERGIETGDGEEESVDKNYKPWGKYDEEKPPRIITQITGMQTDDPQFFQNILDYEEANKDRASIKEILKEKIEELSAESDDAQQEESGTEESGEYLSRQDIEDMNMEELVECVEYNELDPDEIIGERELAAARVRVASALELEWDDEDGETSDSDENSEEPEDEAEPGVEGIDWETLEQLEMSELKDLIKEKDLGFRAGTKTDLNKLREKIAEAMGIQKPAETPWRGYDKRDPEQIIKKLPKLDDEDLGAVFAYEEENDNRSEIMDALNEIAEERGLTTSGKEETDSEQEEDGDQDEGDAGSDASSDSGGEAKKSRRKGSGNEAKEVEEAGREPDHDKLISHVTDRVEKEHFAIPAPLPENITTLPFDLTELSEREVRQHYSAFLSYFGRAAYVAKIEKQLAIACKNVADDAYDDALAALDKIDPETEKDKSATQLKSEAERHPKVRRWRKREREHNALKESMRADCEIYKQNLDSLSREWTMRTEEIDHSGGLGPRGKAGKKPPKNPGNRRGSQ